MYIEQAQKNSIEWWRYLIGTLIILIFWQIIGGMPFVFAIIDKLGIEGLATINEENMYSILENLNATFFYLPNRASLSKISSPTSTYTKNQEEDYFFFDHTAFGVEPHTFNSI